MSYRINDTLWNLGDVRMKYKVITFKRVDDLEEYLNNSDVELNDIKITMNHNLILLVIKNKDE